MTNILTDSERIEKITDYMHVSLNKLAKELGLNNPDRIYHIKRGRNRISGDIAKKIVDLKPEINLSWVLTGEGEMLKSGNIGHIVSGDNSRAGDINVGGIQIKSVDDDTRNRTVLEDKTDTEHYVLLVPISAQAGTLDDFIVSVKGNECERIISPIKGADCAITVSGDSMSPEYPSGSQILIKKINERAFIDWGKVYVLDTCNGIVIKRIFPSDEPGKLKCVSINPEYPSFDVSNNDILGVYRVLLCMSAK